MRPAHLHDPGSNSSCLSDDFCDWIDAWKHNGFWFFDSPALIQQVAAERQIDLSAATLFYYEGFEQEYDPESGWRPYAPEPSFRCRSCRRTGRCFAVSMW